MSLININTLKNLKSLSKAYAKRGLSTNLQAHKRNIVLIDGVRTPFCSSLTSYKNVEHFEFGRAVLMGLVQKVGLPKEIVDYVIMGTVIQEVKTSNIARECLMAAGFPQSTPGHTVTMACISSNQAITAAMQMIESGQCESVIAGGLETMSDVPIRLSRSLRQFLLQISKVKDIKSQLAFAFNNFPSIGLDLPAVTEFSTNESMGESADRMAVAFGVTRKDCDLFALRSHENAANATKSGKLTDLIDFKTSKMKEMVSTDNTIRTSTVEALGKLKPAFTKPHGVITAGNATGLTDGASACLIMSEEKALKLGLKPLAYLRDFHYSAVVPGENLLISPAISMPFLLEKYNLKWKDIGVVEIHEAFAAQVLSVFSAMDSAYFNSQRTSSSNIPGRPDLSTVNSWGGSLALGHPFGATGVRLVTMAAKRLKETSQQLAMIGSCAAGGMGHAMLLENYTKH